MAACRYNPQPHSCVSRERNACFQATKFYLHTNWLSQGCEYIAKFIKKMILHVGLTLILPTWQISQVTYHYCKFIGSSICFIISASPKFAEIHSRKNWFGYWCCLSNKKENWSTYLQWFLFSFVLPLAMKNDHINPQPCIGLHICMFITRSQGHKRCETSVCFLSCSMIHLYGSYLHMWSPDVPVEPHSASQRDAGDDVYTRTPSARSSHVYRGRRTSPGVLSISWQACFFFSFQTLGRPKFATLVLRVYVPQIENDSEGKESKAGESQ